MVNSLNASSQPSDAITAKSNGPPASFAVTVKGDAAPEIVAPSPENAKEMGFPEPEVAETVRL
jgi:hypothetical protein